MTCETCGKNFHNCFSCEVDYYAEVGVCSDSCLKKSDTYRYYLKIVDRFFKSLNKQQLSDYKMISEEIINTIYESEFINEKGYAGYR